MPIGERAEAVVRQFQERQVSTRDALDDLTKLLAEVRDAEHEREESDLGIEAFALFWLFNRMNLPGADRVATAMEAEFERFPHWRRSADQERQVRLALYRALLASGVAEAKLAEVVGPVLDVLKRK